MAYSNKTVPCDPAMFPPPQRWMVWIAELTYGWDHSTNTRTYTPTKEGKLRHFYDFAGARKGIRWVGTKSAYRGENSGKYITDWAIYEWDEATGKWELRYQGFAGQSREDNPISKIRLTRDQKKHPIEAIAEDAVIASILKSAAKAQV